LRHALVQVKPVSQVAKGGIRTFNVPKGTLATSATQPAAQLWSTNKINSIVKRPERAFRSVIPSGAYGALPSPARDGCGVSVMFWAGIRRILFPELKRHVSAV
jgi:hypothetical protein